MESTMMIAGAHDMNDPNQYCHSTTKLPAALHPCNDSDGGRSIDSATTPKASDSAYSVSGPTSYDVVVGSRGTHHSGPGNDRFNTIIDSFISNYSHAGTKAEKGKIFLAIYKTVSSFGRFLCNDPKTGLFFEVNDYVAKEKISHALRYRKKRLLRLRSTGPPAQRRAAILEQTANPAPMFESTSLDNSHRAYTNDDYGKPPLDPSAKLFLLRDAARSSLFQHVRPQEVSLSSVEGNSPTPQFLTIPPIACELFSEEDLTSVLGGAGEFAYW